jgi:neutral trehalase
MVLNLASLITSPEYGSGFVPNGGRAYYTKRSQPPLLSEMTMAVYNVTKNVTFLQYVRRRS